MKKKLYLFSLLILCVSATLFVACSDADFISDDPQYRQISVNDAGGINPDLSAVPYPRLSDYGFFKDGVWNMKPANGVLPFKPASELFTDYAHKQRFVWMPPGTKATYNGDDNALEFPLGTVLIKNFYYENVAPHNIRKIVETRLLIKKAEETETSSGWYAYTYIWQNNQKDALLDSVGNGQFVPITFTENGEERTINYKIPAQSECIMCHKINTTQSVNGEKTIPIGPKPQNLNFAIEYKDGMMNQLQKWISVGYLDSNIPPNINSAIDWKDETQPMELRAKSYLDINCAHCHRVGGHCDYTDVRYNYSNSDLYQLGVCMPPLFFLTNAPYIIKRGDSSKSEIVMRMNTTNQSLMMPLIGRSTVHEEGVDLIRSWIDGMSGECP